MRRVLVAGGTGLVGGSLVSSLRARGDDVAVLTRARARVPSFASAIEIEQWHGDEVERALAGRCFDLVFNLAAYGVDPADKDPAAAETVNCALPRRLVGIARAVGARALVHVGSVFEYAPWTQRRPIPEDAPLECDLVYGASKARGTQAVLGAAEDGGLPTVAIRLFGVFGARERPHRLLPSLVSALSAGRRVSLGTGGQIRDILHVADAAEGLIALSEVAVAGRPCLVNLCNGAGISVAEFAKTTAQIMGAPDDLLGFGELPDRPQDASYLVGDTARLHGLTRWRPRVTLRAGLEEAITAWREKHVNRQR